MRAAIPLFAHDRYWAECFGTAPFLPMSRAEMDALGWDSCDVIIVTGDAYVDHPSFGMAIIGRLLEAQGFRVGLVRGVELEKRFGLTGEPKYWVKRAISLTTGRPQIVKLVFAEVLRARVGDAEFLCRLSAEKEAQVLERTRGDLAFMQGTAARDARGNLVRVLDVIRGQDLLTHLAPSRGPTRSTSARRSLACWRGLSTRCARSPLHATGLNHGDIRNDHLFVDAGSGRLRWIDFDLDPGSPDFDLWSVGNVLHVVAARRVVRIREVLDTRPDLAGRIGAADASVFFPYRLMNLGALYPWLPEPQTAVLRRFAVGDCPRYRAVDEVADELQAPVEALGEASRRRRRRAPGEHR